jgi:hypothetical protein
MIDVVSVTRQVPHRRGERKLISETQTMAPSGLVLLSGRQNPLSVLGEVHRPKCYLAAQEERNR